MGYPISGTPSVEPSGSARGPLSSEGGFLTDSIPDELRDLITVLYGLSWPDGGMVTQRGANPCILRSNRRSGLHFRPVALTGWRGFRRFWTSRFRRGGEDWLRPVSDIEAFTVNVPDLGRSGPVRLVEPSDP